jgi:hypothetical protein
VVVLPEPAVEIAEGKDLTGFLPRAPVLSAEDLEPARVGAILPVLREDGVTRVISLDPLVHPDLAELARVAAGPPAMALHVYALAGAAPRVSLDCGPGCAAALARRARPGAIAIDVDAPAAGILLVRDNHARGWTAAVDGAPAEVRAAGAHMAVAVPAGRHAVTLDYRPPRLRAALLMTACGLAAALAALAGGARGRGILTGVTTSGARP